MTMLEHDERHLWVTRRLVQGPIKTVGRLTKRVAADCTTYEFVYVGGAELYRELVPLPGFPDLNRRYESTDLFPLFTNRQMPRRRPDYGSFLEKLNLPIEADPFEVLGRSEGRRMTDRIEVFPEPERDGAGHLSTVFFTRGVRHIRGASEAIEELSLGDNLALANEPDNKVDPRARLINTQTSRAVGYLPDYLLDVVDHLQAHDPHGVKVTVDHINLPTSAPHMRMLCRLTAPWPPDFIPFSGDEFRPIAAKATTV